jgi:hypothetical protein
LSKVRHVNCALQNRLLRECWHRQPASCHVVCMRSEHGGVATNVCTKMRWRDEGIRIVDKGSLWSTKATITLHVRTH